MCTDPVDREEHDILINLKETWCGVQHLPSMPETLAVIPRKRRSLKEGNVP